MYAAPESGAFQPVAQFKNAWGAAARIWTALSKRYFYDEAYWMQAGMKPDGGRSFWDLVNDKRLSRMERIVFASTFDLHLIRKPEFQEVAQCLREFAAKYPKGQAVCHLPAIADLLDKLAGDDHGLDFTPWAVGWHQTSVSANTLWVKDETNEEEGRLYDLSKDDEAVFVFDFLFMDAAAAEPAAN